MIEVWLDNFRGLILVYIHNQIVQKMFSRNFKDCMDFLGEKEVIEVNDISF